MRTVKFVSPHSVVFGLACYALGSLTLSGCPRSELSNGEDTKGSTEVDAAYSQEVFDVGVQLQLAKACDDGNDGPWDGCEGGKASEFSVDPEPPVGGYRPPVVASLSKGSYAVVSSRYSVAGEPSGPSDLAGSFFDSESGTWTNSEIFSNSYNLKGGLTGLENEHYVVAWIGSAEEETEAKAIHVRFVESDGAWKTDDILLAQPNPEIGPRRFTGTAGTTGGQAVVAWLERNAYLASLKSEECIHGPASKQAVFRLVGGDYLSPKYVVSGAIVDSPLDISIASNDEIFMFVWADVEYELSTEMGCYVWTASELRGSTFSFDGDILVDQFAIHPKNGPPSAGRLWLTALADGSFILASGADKHVHNGVEEWGISLRKILPDGTLVHDTFLPLSPGEGVGRLDVAGLTDGSLLLSWFASSVEVNPIFGRTFTADLMPTSEKITITAPNTWAESVSVAPLPDGGAIVTWLSLDEDERNGIMAVLLNADLEKVWYQ